MDGWSRVLSTSWILASGSIKIGSEPAPEPIRLEPCSVALFRLDTCTNLALAGMMAQSRSGKYSTSTWQTLKLQRHGRSVNVALQLLHAQGRCLLIDWQEKEKEDT